MHDHIDKHLLKCVFYLHDQLFFISFGGCGLWTEYTAFPTLVTWLTVLNRA